MKQIKLYKIFDQEDNLNSFLKNLRGMCNTSNFDGNIERPKLTMACLILRTSAVL